MKEENQDKNNRWTTLKEEEGKISVSLRRDEKDAEGIHVIRILEGRKDLISPNYWKEEQIMELLRDGIKFREFERSEKNRQIFFDRK